MTQYWRTHGLIVTVRWHSSTKVLNHIDKHIIESSFRHQLNITYITSILLFCLPLLMVTNRANKPPSFIIKILCQFIDRNASHAVSSMQVIKRQLLKYKASSIGYLLQITTPAFN